MLNPQFEESIDLTTSQKCGIYIYICLFGSTYPTRALGGSVSFSYPLVGFVPRVPKAPWSWHRSWGNSKLHCKGQHLIRLIGGNLMSGKTNGWRIPLPEINRYSPWKVTIPKRKPENSLPTIHFQGRTVSFREGNVNFIPPGKDRWRGATPISIGWGMRS